MPIFLGRLRTPLRRTGHLGLLPRPLLSERALAHRVSAVSGNLAPRPAGPATKVGTSSRCGPDAEHAELGAWLTTNRCEVIGAGLRHRRPALNLSRTSGAGCSRSITVANAPARAPTRNGCRRRPGHMTTRPHRRSAWAAPAPTPVCGPGARPRARSTACASPTMSRSRSPTASR